MQRLLNQRGSIKMIGLLALGVVLALGVGFLTFKITSRNLRKSTEKTGSKESKAPTLPALPTPDKLSQKLEAPDKAPAPETDKPAAEKKAPASPAAATADAAKPVAVAKAPGGAPQLSTPTPAPIPTPPAVPVAAPTPTSSGSGPAVKSPREKEQEARLMRIGKIYGTMPAEQAAAVITTLTDDEAIKILGNMNERQTAKVFAQLEPKRVASITRKMGLGEKKL